MKQFEVWSLPSLPTPVKHIKVHPEGNRNSAKQTASSKYARNRQKNKGLQEQEGRSDMGATTSANKQVKN